MTNTILPTNSLTRLKTGLIQLFLMLFILYFISLYNYVFFHSLTEVITAIISAGIFTVTWNSRRFIDNNYYLVIGISFLIIGIINILHAFIYKGVDILQPEGNANIATQLWLASRYLLSLSFILAPYFIKRKLNPRIGLLAYTITLLVIIFSIFYWKIFPVAYIDNLGLTKFKIVSEYIIIFLFILATALLYGNKTHFDKRVFRLLFWTLIFFIISELSFTFYFQVTDIFNLLGHLIGLIAFYLAYLAIVELSLMKPYHTLFRELHKRELQLALERDKLIGIFDNMKDGVYITSQNYDIEYANPALQKDFGPIHSDKIKCYQYLHDRTEPCPWCKNKQIFSGETVRWEWYYPKNKKTYDIMDSPLKTPDGIKSKLEIFRDISEKKELEKLKDEFISLASHQLRTPLSSISLSAELLLRGIAGEIRPEEREYLDEIYRSTKRMSILIGNFLNISRIEMGTFEIKPVSLNLQDKLDQIIKSLLPLIEEKNIHFSKNFSQTPLVNFDENALEIIIENLLSNAIRYTPDKGKISIEMTTNSTHILIKIIDTGCGIPDNQKEKIFSKSFRADNAKEITSQGIGLGLYMIKLLSQKQNVNIWFDSKINEGSIFYVSIPIN